MHHLEVFQSENVIYLVNDMHSAPLLDVDTELSFEQRQPFYMADYHWHQQVEINVLHKGTLEYGINNASVKVSAGEMVVFWAVTPHRVSKVSDDALVGIINIPLSAFLGWVLPQEFVQQVMHGGVITSHTDGIISLAESNRWLNCYHGENSVRNGIVSDEVCLMLRRLCSFDYKVEMFSFLRNGSSRHPNDTGYKNVQLMLDYIAKNHNKDIKVDDIAAHVKLHPKYAMGLFKNMLNVSIKQYLIIMRINHAKVLLSNTRNPIKNIANDSGFKHPGSFFAAFKSHTGLTPQQFRSETQIIS
ncbi:helix-turn-helix domain-containing protein [Photobacterium rosenbergii]|uniref:Helix-turn-helix domain-containing protein n=1 Tax=Photobacterium rosenbergii TaxID=294936 RepID=A0ABU3ZG74_9GAMM|nr:helix-turn-helix domain-containing protein [Photobacterium rosenbergii]MDV5169106.1 helix-turn-helix domain-containing protein [Photobacterium rosenbergii]